MRREVPRPRRLGRAAQPLEELPLPVEQAVLRIVKQERALQIVLVKDKIPSIAV